MEVCKFWYYHCVYDNDNIFIAENLLCFKYNFIILDIFFSITVPIIQKGSGNITILHLKK